MDLKYSVTYYLHETKDLKVSLWVVVAIMSHIFTQRSENSYNAT